MGISNKHTTHVTCDWCSTAEILEGKPNLPYNIPENWILIRGAELSIMNNNGSFFKVPIKQDLVFCNSSCAGDWLQTVIDRKTPNVP